MVRRGYQSRWRLGCSVWAAPSLIPATAIQTGFSPHEGDRYDAQSSDHDRPRRTTDTGKTQDGNPDPLLSDEPTIESVIEARAGDRAAVEALLQRCLPHLKRWAHGKLPPAARGDHGHRGDLVQDAALHALRAPPRLRTPARRRDAGLPLRQSRHQSGSATRCAASHGIRPPWNSPKSIPRTPPLPWRPPSKAESYERYRQALGTLRPRDREMVVARVEVQWSLAEIAQRFGMRTADAARMAVEPRAAAPVGADVTADVLTAEATLHRRRRLDGCRQPLRLHHALRRKERATPRKSRCSPRA